MSGGMERGPYAKGVERREAILETTLAAFSQFGAAGTSLRSIAASVGISPSLLRHYFSSREALLMAVIEAWDASHLSADAEGLTFTQHFVAAIRRNSDIPGLVHLYTVFVVEACDPDHPSRSYFTDRYAKLRSDIAADIRTLQQRGAVDAGRDADREARLLVAACEGLQVQWLYSQDFDMAREFQYLLERFGLAKLS